MRLLSSLKWAISTKTTVSMMGGDQHLQRCAFVCCRCRRWLHQRKVPSDDLLSAHRKIRFDQAQQSRNCPSIKFRGPICGKLNSPSENGQRKNTYLKNRRIMKKVQKILGLPIISITEGRELGISKSLLIDAKNGSVSALIIEDAD